MKLIMSVERKMIKCRILYKSREWRLKRCNKSAWYARVRTGCEKKFNFANKIQAILIKSKRWIAPILSIEKGLIYQSRSSVCRYSISIQNFLYIGVILIKNVERKLIECRILYKWVKWWLRSCLEDDLKRNNLPSW